MCCKCAKIDVHKPFADKQQACSPHLEHGQILLVNIRFILLNSCATKRGIADHNIRWARQLFYQRLYAFCIA